LVRLYAKDYFWVVKMTTSDQPREVLYESDVFTDTIVLAGHETITIPIDNSRLMYELIPATYRDAFKGTSLEGVRADINGNGEYVIVNQ